jgi:hypothetical protein
MDNWPKLLGGLFALLFFGIPAFASFAHARKPRPLSLRLANFALGCGFLGLVLWELLFIVDGEFPAQAMLISGFVRLGIIATGMVLAILAFVKRGDGGVGWGRPLAAVLVCVFHLFMTSGIFMFALMRTGVGNPWTYQAPDGAFSITLPSAQWEQVPAKDPANEVSFSRRRPDMRANVTIDRGKTRFFYTLKVKQIRDLLTGPKALASQVQFEEGPKDDGPTFLYFTGWETTADGKTLFVAGACWWFPDKKAVITVFLEGQAVMAGITGKAAEKDTFLKSARSICMSVK